VVNVRYRVLPTSRQMCGVDSLYVCLRSAGNREITLLELEQILSIGPKGLSLAELTDACHNNGVAATAVRLDDLSLLADWGNPAVLHVGERHFIAFLGREDGRYVFFDNLTGLVDSTPEWFAAHYKWDGVALIVGPPPPALVARTYGPPLLLIVGGCGLFTLFVGWWLRHRPAVLHRDVSLGKTVGET
jgi:ABC-type bacteriocin/lantibiotic exporter with double-glycine peptidase domain